MITDLDPYPGGPKTYGASGSGTLVLQKRNGGTALEKIKSIIT
jgi:hypothetical protein